MGKTWKILLSGLLAALLICAACATAEPGQTAIETRQVNCSCANPVFSGQFVNGTRDPSTDLYNPNGDFEHVHMEHYLNGNPVCSICGKPYAGSTSDYYLESIESCDWLVGRVSVCQKCGNKCGDGEPYHDFDLSGDGTCYWCGYVCPHDGDIETCMNYEDTQVSEIAGNDEYHIATRAYSLDTVCATCYLPFSSVYAGEESEVLAWHEYDDDTCMLCGHVCSHSSTHEISYWDEENGVTGVPVDLRYHDVTGSLITEVVCDYCTTVISSNAETVTRRVNHNDWYFENDDGDMECGLCGYINTCNHEWVSTEITADWDRYEDTGSDDTHARYHCDVWNEECSLCGMINTIEEEGTPSTEAHEYTNLDYCKLCCHHNSGTAALAVPEQSFLPVVLEGDPLEFEFSAVEGAQSYALEIDGQEYAIALGDTQLQVSLQAGVIHQAFIVAKADGMTGGRPEEGTAVAVVDPDCVLTLPGELTEIDEEAFAGTAVQMVVVPDGVTSIGDGAFADCPDLVAVVLPEGDIDIGDGAFGEANPVIIEGLG